MDPWSKVDYSRHIREASMVMEKLPEVNPPSGSLLHVTPQKSGYRFLCCYSFQPFLPRNFPLGTGEPRQSLTLQHLPLPFLQVKIPSPCHSPRDIQEYCRVRCNVLHISLIPFAA